MKNNLLTKEEIEVNKHADKWLKKHSKVYSDEEREAALRKKLNTMKQEKN